MDGADFGGRVVAPVVAGEERFFVSSSRERAQDIKIGQPARQKVKHWVAS